MFDLLAQTVRTRPTHPAIGDLMVNYDFLLKLIAVVGVFQLVLMTVTFLMVFQLSKKRRIEHG